MKFHTSAVIYGHDLASVRRALLAELQDLAIEITSSDSEDSIMIHGFGPGRVSMNYDDYAVLTIDEQLNDVSIEVLGAFDGSYLEDREAQESEVRSKLEQVFDLAQKQMDLQQPRSTDKPKAQDITLPANTLGTPEAIPFETVPAAARMPADDRLSAGGAWRGERTVPEGIPERGREVHPAVRFRQFSLVAAAIAVLMVTIAGVDSVQKHLHPQNLSVSASPGSDANNRLSSEDQVAADASVNNFAQTHRPGGQEVDHAAANAPGPDVTRFQPHARDPATFVKSWEAAMRTRNAIEQSAFYNDPVDRYDGVNHLNWTALEQKKQAEIASRKGLWTVKLEQIEVEQRGSDEARIGVIQHVIDQPAPSQILEQFIRTELGLRRVKGGWRIVSEENVAESPDPLPPRS